MKYADMGTHSDFQLTGQMPTKRMTAYETQAARGAGELKLRVSLLISAKILLVASRCSGRCLTPTRSTSRVS